jgi:hypothetical protein
MFIVFLEKETNLLIYKSTYSICKSIDYDFIILISYARFDKIEKNVKTFYFLSLLSLKSVSVSLAYTFESLPWTFLSLPWTFPSLPLKFVPQPWRYNSLISRLKEFPLRFYMPLIFDHSLSIHIFHPTSTNLHLFRKSIGRFRKRT